MWHVSEKYYQQVNICPQSQRGKHRVGRMGRKKKTATPEEVQALMAEAGFVYHGAVKKIADHIGVSRPNLSGCLHGRITGQAAGRHLYRAKKYLLLCIGRHGVKSVVPEKQTAKKTINSHLEILGVQSEILYTKGRNYHRGGYGSIYQRLEPWEIYELAEHAYKRSIRLYHPDLHPIEEREHYQAITTQLNRSRDAVHRILRHKGVRV